MKIKVFTTFPEMIRPIVSQSILGRAVENGLLAVEAIDIREYAENKHRNTDDYPFGGGAGMVMLAQPIVSAFRAHLGPDFRGRRIYLSPKGAPFTQKKAEELAGESELALLCGHYEGVDQRFLDECVDEEISMGDFVLTGGEIPAMAIVDAVSRLIPGVLGDEVCFTDESHWSGLLEYPQYSRPDDWHGLTVPEVLRSGDHAKVARWQKKQSILRTLHRRPDLFYKLRFPYKTRAERKFIAELEAEDDDFRDRDPKNLDYRK